MSVDGSDDVDQGKSSDSEPADPPLKRLEGSQRRETRIAPPSMDVDRLPTPLVECGCEDCPDSLVDPLADSEAELYAVDRCPEPRPMTVERTSEAYLRYQRAAWNSDRYVSTYERALDTYAGLLDTDRQLQRRFDRLTTVMVTRRLSPLDDTGEWLPPVAIDAQLHDEAVMRSLTRSLRYHLDGFNFEYVGVTAATDSAATPHEHVFLWIDDPHDGVTVDHVAPALEKHVSKATNAHEGDHEYRDDGSTGAITVRHDPPLVDHVPDEGGAIIEESKASDGGSVPANTAGAQYIASQLPHLVLGDVYESGQDTSQARIDGGAVAWASPWKWTRSSSGIDL